MMPSSTRPLQLDSSTRKVTETMPLFSPSIQLARAQPWDTKDDPIYRDDLWLVSEQVRYGVAVWVGVCFAGIGVWAWRI